MTEQLHFHFSLSCIEGNGNPLQCSCLENPRDGGAWWAAVYGVAQSWTRLKWLSSSSSINILITLLLCIMYNDLKSAFPVQVISIMSRFVFQFVVVSPLSLVWRFDILWTVAHQAPLSMGFPRQEYWSGLSCPSPGDLPSPRMELMSPVLAGRFFTAEPPGKPLYPTVYSKFFLSILKF